MHNTLTAPPQVAWISSRIRYNFEIFNLKTEIFQIFLAKYGNEWEWFEFHCFFPVTLACFRNFVAIGCRNWKFCLLFNELMDFWLTIKDYLIFSVPTAERRVFPFTERNQWIGNGQSQQQEGWIFETHISKIIYLQIIVCDFCWESDIKKIRWLFRPFWPYPGFVSHSKWSTLRVWSVANVRRTTRSVRSCVQMWTAARPSRGMTTCSVTCAFTLDWGSSRLGMKIYREKDY